MMSNDLVELKPSCYGRSTTDDVIETIFTARVIPGDETSPLKFGKLQRLHCHYSKIGARGINAIVQNLPQLTHLDLTICKTFDDAAMTMTALIGDEHVDPLQPYPALPNLIYLSLRGSSITDQGCIELSKSQLLDQLEYLTLKCLVERGTTQIGETALLTTPLYSNMRKFATPQGLSSNDNPPQKHLSNADNNFHNYFDSTKIDQFWSDE